MSKLIPNFPNYTIDEFGNVYSIKRDIYLKTWSHSKGSTVYATLKNKAKIKHLNVAKLVLKLFQPSQTKINTYAIHKDLELTNCANFNLERGNRSDRKRMFNEIRGKVRGVYSWKGGKNKWRAVIKTPQGNTKTLGYFKNKWYAQFVFNMKYKEYYGNFPY